MDRRRFGTLAFAGLTASVTTPFVAGMRPVLAAEMEQTMAFYARSATDRGLRFLRTVQNDDGGWDGGVSNTAMALQAFVTSYQRYIPGDGPFITKPISRLVDVLSARESGRDETVSVVALAQAVIGLRTLNDREKDALIAGAQRVLASAPPGAEGGGVTERQVEIYLALTAVRGSVVEGVEAFRTRAHAAIADLQLPSGGFPGSDGSEAFAMTCAGAASLAAAIQPEDDGVLAAALRRVVETYSAEPAPMNVDGPVFFHYDPLVPAMERVERGAGDGGIGTHANWRDTMAYALLQMQFDDGGWLPDAPPEDRVAATARAVTALNEALA